jgi:hypothetical protein
VVDSHVGTVIRLMRFDCPRIELYCTLYRWRYTLGHLPLRS